MELSTLLCNTGQYYGLLTLNTAVLSELSVIEMDCAYSHLNCIFPMDFAQSAFCNVEYYLFLFFNMSRLYIEPRFCPVDCHRHL